MINLNYLPEDIYVIEINQIPKYNEIKKTTVPEIYNITNYLLNLSEKQYYVKNLISERLRLKKLDKVMCIKRILKNNLEIRD